MPVSPQHHRSHFIIEISLSLLIASSAQAQTGPVPWPPIAAPGPIQETFLPTPAPPALPPAPDEIQLPALPYTGAGIPAQTVPAVSNAGIIQGQPSVSDSGEALYQLPLWLPPSVGATQPELTLTYNHRRRNNGLGRGFSINLGSTIYRCSISGIDSLPPRAVTGANNDALCLDGQPLVRAEDTPSGVVFYPREFTGLKILGVGGTTDSQGVKGNFAYFDILSGSGVTKRYGEVTVPNGQAGAVISRATPGGQKRFVWFLATALDQFSNATRYQYLDHGADLGASDGVSPPLHVHELRLETISYGGTSAQSTSPFEIRFDWGDGVGLVGLHRRQNGSLYSKPAWRGVLMRDGIAFRNRHLLTSIRLVSASPNTSSIRDYRFQYTRSPYSGEPLLTRFDECSNNVCIGEGVRFKYDSTNYPGQSGDQGIVEIGPASINDPMFGFFELDAGVDTYGGPDIALPGLADLNGDGVNDLYYGRYVDAPGDPGITTIWVHFGKSPTGRLTTCTDISSSQTVSGVSSLDGWGRHTNRPNWPSAPFEHEACALFQHHGFIEAIIPADFNRDGKSDLLVKYSEALNWFGLYSHFNATQGYTLRYHWDHGYQERDALTDVNRDGYIDFIGCTGRSSDTVYIETYDPLSDVFSPPQNISGSSCRYGVRTTYADLNGDGLPEKIERDNREITWLTLRPDISHLERTTYPSSSDTNVGQFGDFNGDGIVDHIAGQHFLDEDYARDLTTIQFGTGFGLEFITLADNLPSLYPYEYAAADWDGDGDQDLIGTGGGVVGFLQMRGGVNSTKDNGDHANIHVTNNFGPMLSPQYTSKWHVYGDFNSDGATDAMIPYFIDHRARYRTFSVKSGRTRDVLTEVHQSPVGISAPSISFEYSSETDPSVYSTRFQPEDCGRTKPFLCKPPSGLTLVKELSIRNSLNEAPETTRYRYHDALSTFDGHGFLGFEFVEKENQSRQQLLITQREVSLTPEHPNGTSFLLEYNSIVRTIQITSSEQADRPGADETWISTTQSTIDTRHPLGNPSLRSSEVATTTTEDLVASPTHCSIEWRTFFLEGTAVSGTCSGVRIRRESRRFQRDDFGNIEHEEVFYGDLDDPSKDRVTIHRTFEAAGFSDWLIHLVRDEVTTDSRASGQEATREIHMEPNLTHGGLPTTITYGPISNPRMVQHMAYDSRGRLQNEVDSGTGAGCREKFYVYAQSQFASPTQVHQIENANCMATRHSAPTSGTLATAVWYHQNFGSKLQSRASSGALTEYAYDSFGRLVGSRENQASETHFTYLAGSLSEVEGASHIVRSQGNNGAEGYEVFDFLGRPTLQSNLDAFGKWTTTRVLYDSLGRPTSHSLPALNESWSGKALGSFARYTLFDSLGRELGDIEPDGSRTYFLYRPGGISTPGQTGFGLEVRSFDGSNRQTSKFYSPRGELLSVRSGHSTVSFAYGPFGQLVETRDPEGRTRISEFDRFGNVVYESDPDLGERWRSYNGFNELRETVAADATRSYLEYDSFGRVRWEARGDGSNPPTYRQWKYYSQGTGKGLLNVATGPDGTSEYYEYDSFGRALRETQKIGGEEFNFFFAYDSLGRRSRDTFPANGLPLGQDFHIERGYSNGHLTSVESPLSSIWRLVGQTYQDLEQDPSTGVYIPISSSRTVRKGAGEGAIWTVESRTAFDRARRLLAFGAEGGQSTLLAARRYDYEPSHLMSARVDEKFGQRESFEYDQARRVTRSCVDSETSMAPPADIQTLSRNEQSLVPAVNYPIFDPVSNLAPASELDTSSTGPTTRNGSGSYGSSASLSVPQILDLESRGHLPRSLSQPAAGCVTYQYSPGGRIVYRSDKGTYEYGEPVGGFGYLSNPFDNYLTAAGLVLRNISGATHRIVDSSGSVLTSVTHDLRGRVTATGGKSITWTAWDRPRNYHGPQIGQVDFEYGVSLQRVKKMTPAEDTVYVGPFEQSRINAQSPYLPGSRDVNTYRVVVDGRTAVEVTYERDVGAWSVASFVEDPLGSPLLVAGDDSLLSSGAVRQDVIRDERSYSAWGELRSVDWIGQGSGTGLSFRRSLLSSGSARRRSRNRGFEGHEDDEGAGFVNMTGRIYLPELAQFALPDPLISSPENPQDYNRYSFAWNSPLNILDPTGLAEIHDTYRDPATLSAGSHVMPAAELSKDRRYRAMLLVTISDAGEVTSVEEFVLPSEDRAFWAAQTGERSADGTPWSGLGCGLSLRCSYHRLASAAEGFNEMALWRLKEGDTASEARLASNRFWMQSFLQVMQASADVVGLAGLSKGLGRLGGDDLAAGRGRQKPGELPAGQSVEGMAGGGSPWTADLGNVTGRAASARNKAIGAVISEDLPNLRLTHVPEYSPFAKFGVAKQGVGTQIGRKSFSSRNALRDSIVHEEVHHRWWSRGIKSPHHSPDTYVPDERFYNVIRRYMRMRGW